MNDFVIPVKNKEGAGRKNDTLSKSGKEA